jgi:hypothetical protein
MALSSPGANSVLAPIEPLSLTSRYRDFKKVGIHAVQFEAFYVAILLSCKRF